MREERKSIIVMNMSGWTVIFPRNINISAEADIYPKISLAPKNFIISLCSILVEIIN